MRVGVDATEEVEKVPEDEGVFVDTLRSGQAEVTLATDDGLEFLAEDERTEERNRNERKLNVVLRPKQQLAVTQTSPQK